MDNSTSMDEAATPSRAGMNRREFLARIAALGATLGAPPLLGSCGGSSTDTPRSALQKRLLFFNLSRMTGATSTDCHLYIAGQRLLLTPTSQAPQLLQMARRSNAFLQAVPEASITHHLEAELPTSAVALGYISADEDPQTGSWSMPMLHLLLPESAHVQAVSGMQGAMPHSMKRRFYGLPAARSAADLIQEAAYIDSHDHAHALVGVHPQLLSLDAASAAYVHVNHIAPNPDLLQLASTLSRMGPARVQRAAGQHNPLEWATLRPLRNDRASPPAPFRKSDGRLNQYTPDWHPDVDAAVAQCIRTTHPRVNNDERLGLDVSAGRSAMTSEAARGRLWFRHDGLASIERGQGKAMAADDAPALAFSSLTSEVGLAVRTPKVEKLGNAVQLTLDNVDNWFLRWLGVWVKFNQADANGGSIPIPTASLPANTLPNAPEKHPRGIDTAESIFVGLMSDVNAVAGVPFMPATIAPVIQLPPNAASMEVIYGGMGFAGSLIDPESLHVPGFLATLLVDYALANLFLAAGFADIEGLGKQLAVLMGEVLIEELIALCADLINGTASVEEFVLTFCKTVFETGVGAVLEKFWGLVAAAIGTATLTDSIPVAGQIARAAAVTIALVELTESAIEVGLSPQLYRFHLAFTHDLSTSFDIDAAFLASWNGYTLYYKASYVFDTGAAHVLNAVDLTPSANGGKMTVTVQLKGIPYGGNVNIMVGIYARQPGTPIGPNDLVAAHGSTGLVPNNSDTAPAIALVYNRVPISATTIYLHDGKTGLDANGQHVWQTGLQGRNAPAYLPPTGGQQPSLGDLRGITVRQSVGGRPGYVGFAWQGYSSGFNRCGSDTPGQFDYVGILNTDTSLKAGNFVASSCGAAAGTLPAFSLLSDDVANIILDPSALLLRPVGLGSSPALLAPASGLALGKLNLPATRLLLHPAGYAVSINAENHKLETLKLPQLPVDETTASRSWLARAVSGYGQRPGLMDTPVAAAISADGVILVLEDSSGNNRIQAFDIGGNPIRFFTKQKQPYFLPLDATQNASYLDLAVEFSGFVYVLSIDEASVHWLDVYHRDQEGTAPLCRSSGVNAARMAVNFWRTVYTLNYEILTLPNGAIPSLTEPSVSYWIPSNKTS